MARQLYDYWFVQFDFPDENGSPYNSSGGKMNWNEKLKLNMIRINEYNRRMYYLKADWDAARKESELKSASTRSVRD